MKTRFILPLLLAIPLFAQAAPPSAVDRPDEGKMAHHGMSHRMGEDFTPPFLHGLKLTDSQKDQIFKLMHEQAPALREKAKAAHNTMEELRKLGMSDKLDEARAKSLADTAARAQSEMALMRLKTDQQIYALLTAEQRSKMADGKNCR